MSSKKELVTFFWRAPKKCFYCFYFQTRTVDFEDPGFLKYGPRFFVTCILMLMLHFFKMQFVNFVSHCLQMSSQRSGASKFSISNLSSLTRNDKLLKIMDFGKTWCYGLQMCGLISKGHESTAIVYGCRSLEVLTQVVEFLNQTIQLKTHL